MQLNDLILKVDKEDKILGEIDKEKAHLGDGILHRAFLVAIFDNDEKILLTKRSANKKLWPGFWDGSIASHYKNGQEIKEAVCERIFEEAGIKISDIDYFFKFYYHCSFKDIGSEKEICYFLKAKTTDDKFILNKKEIENVQWKDVEDVKKDINKNPEIFTPWFKIAFNKITKTSL